MKTLLALISCHSRPAYADAQRETWIPRITAGLDYKFFLGPSERTPREDEVFLQCDDSYQGLPNKVQEVVRWSQAHEYDHILKCDDDVVLLPDQFMNSGFQNYDFVGHKNHDGGSIVIPWGFCYTLSRKAMSFVATAPLPPNNNDEAWIAYLLATHGILLHEDRRYYLYRGKSEDFITPKKRPLRAPRRDHFDFTVDPVPGTFAWAMYISWLGYRELPEARNIEEMKKIFKKAQGL